MMSPRLLHRVRESLGTFMAEIRPLPSELQREDYSYRLTEDAFVLQHHSLKRDSFVLTAHPLMKAVHSEYPEGWLLYAMTADGHWQPYAESVFSPDLSTTLNTVRAHITPTDVAPVLKMTG